MPKDSGQVNTELGNLNDTALSKYMADVNLKYIEQLRFVASMKIGSKAYRDAYIRQRAIEQVYGRAVKMAIERGLLIVH